jgi:hypothetical protein
VSGAPPIVSVIDVTINQLRAYCPPFAGRVAGAADFRKGLQNYNATLTAPPGAFPAGWVVPLDQDSEGNQNYPGGTGLQQIVTKRVAVIVEFDARPDRRSQAPTSEYDDMEAALFAAILNWRPVQCRMVGNQGYWFAGGNFLDLDRARLFYQWVFALNWQITDADGWHEPDPAPPLSVEVDLYNKRGALPVEDPPDVAFAKIPIPDPDYPDDTETLTREMEDGKCV